MEGKEGGQDWCGSPRWMVSTHRWASLSKIISAQYITRDKERSCCPRIEKKGLTLIPKCVKKLLWLSEHYDFSQYRYPRSEGLVNLTINLSFGPRSKRLHLSLIYLTTACDWWFSDNTALKL